MTSRSPVLTSVVIKMVGPTLRQNSCEGQEFGSSTDRINNYNDESDREHPAERVYIELDT